MQTPVPEAREAIPGLPVLVLSQHVEQLYAREPLSDSPGGIGYFLRDRVSDVEQFVESVPGSPPAARLWTPMWSPSC